MRKDALQSLIQKYEASRAESKEPEDTRITDLRAFLDTEAIRLLADSDQVSVEDFNGYLFEKYPNRDLTRLFDHDFLTKPDCKLILSSAVPSKKQAEAFQKPTYVLIKNTFRWECTYYEHGKKIREIPIKVIDGLKNSLDALPKRAVDTYSTIELDPVLKKIKQYHQQLAAINVSVLFKEFFAAERVMRPKVPSSTNNHPADMKSAAAPTSGTPPEIKKTIPARKAPAVDDTKSYLSKIPKAVRDNVLAKLLDDKSVAALTATSSSFYAEATTANDWKDRLIKAGCDGELLEKVIKTKAIKNYKNLYSAFTRMQLIDRKKNVRKKIVEPWELLCLSGDPGAIKYAIKHKLVDANKKNTLGESVLHLAALSGSAAAIAEAKTIPGLNLTAVNNYGTNALHFAARSGSAAAMAEAKTILGLDLTAVNNTGSNAMHFAARSGSAAAIAEAKTIPGLRALNYALANALHFAAWSGSVAAMKEAKKIPGVNPKAADNLGTNALHFAAWSGSVAAMKEAKKILGIKDLTAVTKQGNNAMHFAAYSGSAAAIAEAKTIPGLDLTAVTKQGNNAMHIAANSGSVAAMVEAKTIPGLDLTAVDKYGNNAMHFAAWSGSAAAIAEAKTITGLNLTAVNNNGQNVLHFAAWSGSAAAMIEAKKILGLDLTAVNKEGLNVLHFAALSGSVAAMVEAKTIPGLNLTAVNNYGNNAMHFAVRSNNPAAILFLRQLSLTYSLGFDPNTPNHAGETPFSLADNSAEIPLRAALRNALTVPVEPLEVPNENEEKQSPSLSKR